MSSLRALPGSPPSRLPLGLSALHELEAATASEWGSKGGYSPQDETLASVLGLPEVVLGCEGWMRGGVLSETDPLSLRPLFLNQELSAAGVWQGRLRARYRSSHTPGDTNVARSPYFGWSAQFLPR